MGSCNDQEEVVGHLTDPTAKANVFLGQPFHDPGSALDWVSPTHIANWFVKKITGKDYFEEAAKFFAGDWEAIWKLSGALKCLAEAVPAVAINVSFGKYTMDQHWNGRASDAAFVYFTQLATGIRNLSDPLDQLAQQLGRAAEGAWRQSQVYSGLLKDAWDAAIFAALAAGVGTGTSWTGVGAAIGYGSAGLLALRVLQKLAKAATIPNLANKAMNAFVGQIKASAAQVRDFKKLQLPAGGYNHPATK